MTGKIMTIPEHAKSWSNCALNLQCRFVNPKVCVLDMHIQGAKLFQILGVFRYGLGKKVLA